MVRRMFELYDCGLNGREKGCKEIASHFNERGLLSVVPNGSATGCSSF